MPQSASEPRAAVPTFKPLSAPPRSNNGPQRPESPFSSLLDDNTPPTQDQNAGAPPKAETSQQPANAAGANDENPAQTASSRQKGGPSTDDDSASKPGADQQAATDQAARANAVGTNPAGTKPTDAKPKDAKPKDATPTGAKPESANPDSVEVASSKPAKGKSAKQCKLDADKDADKSGKSAATDGKSVDATPADGCKRDDTAAVQAAVTVATPTPVAAASAVVTPVVAAAVAVQAAPADPGAKACGAVGTGAATIADLKLLKNASASQNAGGKPAADSAKAGIDKKTADDTQTATTSGTDKPAHAAAADKTDKDAVVTDTTAKDAPAHSHTDAAAAVHHDPTQGATPSSTGVDPNAATGADPTQTQQINQTQQTPAAANAAPAGQTLTQAPVPVAGLAVEIAGRAASGKNHFEIRLDPPDLGRIDVHLKVDRDGQVTSHLVVDRPDTLDLLRRDSTGLERALQDAGLKTSYNGLQFSLRDQTMNQNPNTPTTPNIARVIVPDDTLPVIESTQRIYSRLAGMGSGLDIRV